MTVISYLLSCYKPAPSYRPLNKKDDNWGIEDAHAWIEKHKIDGVWERARQEWNKAHPGGRDAYSNFMALKIYAAQVIQDLNTVPITTSNYPEIRAHLRALSLIDEWLREAMLKELSASKSIDKEFQKNLCCCLI